MNTEHYKGLISIDNEKRVDWHKIRAEYISGGISYREIAKKYNVPFGTVRHRAQVEQWVKEREIAEHNVNTATAQKLAEAATDNATLAANIKRKGLMILDRLFDDYMEVTATEHRETRPGLTKVKRLRDLTAAYKDLTDDIQTTNSATSELLQSLLELERRQS